MRHRRKLSQNARGTASLEMAMGLPLLFLLLVTIYTFASAALTRNETTFTARLNVSTGQDEPWRDSPSYHSSDLQLVNHQVLAKIIGPNPPLPTSADLPVSAVSQEVPYVANPWRGLIPDAQAHAATAGASWDFRHIPFPAQSEHPRLVLMDKVKFLSDRQDFQLDAFAALAKLNGTNADPHARDTEKLVLDKLKQMDGLQDEEAEVRDGLVQVPKEISELKAELEIAENAPSKNPGRIEGLNKELSDLNTALRKLPEAEETFSARRSFLAELHKRSLTTEQNAP